MIIGFLCDLHLPPAKEVLQYDVMQWALDDLTEKKPDCIAFAGDVTCDGNREVYHHFVKKMQSLGIPFLFIPGNSDLRCPDCCEEISRISSPCENHINGIRIFAVNDCTADVSDEQITALEKADDHSIVFMHHPVAGYPEKTRQTFSQWRKNHENTMVFYGHHHESVVEGNDIGLQALDPDKAVGECPCITYYDTDTRKLRKSYYPAPVPQDMYPCFGISCYDTIGHIEFGIQNGLVNLELRPNCIHADRALLTEKIAQWRQNGGKNLCIHLPDVTYQDGVAVSPEMDRFMELARDLKADRLTQHVPRVSVEAVQGDPSVLDRICGYLAEQFNSIPHPMVIGVENMHMTAQERPDETRRFGYLPEECLAFMNALAAKCSHKVGINFDIGHARNNIPFSQAYQISTWLAMVGKHIVGYHIHQVTPTEEKYVNHTAITHIYGRLISFASFFKCWSNGIINKAPVIFEMDTPADAYSITLKTFQQHQ